MGEAVRVENFSFRYSEGSKYAVKNFNLRVRERDSDTRGTERMREVHLLRSINGRMRHVCVEHPVHLRIDAVGRFAGDHISQVVARHAFAYVFAGAGKFCNASEA